ncbi:MAG: hypothetical protein PHR20_05020 [Bacteroidales bacterium]|nr:hypothetical protein [Bacteroidales bacterium]
MKKITLLLLSLFLCVTVFAQDDATVSPDQFKIEHEFTIGIGDPSINSLLSGNANWICYDPCISQHYDWFGTDTYLGNKYTTPSITASYMLRLKKWLWLGGQINYFGTYQNVNDLFTEETICRNHTEMLSIIPTVRFSYLNKKYVTLYSSVGLGLSMCSNVSHPIDPETALLDIQMFPAFQITYIGISVGHKFYGFTELGCGNKGFIYAGFGYRFGNM